MYDCLSDWFAVERENSAKRENNKKGGINEEEKIIQHIRDNMDQQNTDSDVDQMIDDFPDEVSAGFCFLSF